ncbi:MAG: 50S ribosomal protein L24 [Candidatus Magasanikbacteria bacterium RIFCSPLOWO2_02_FULL_44_11]|uniref:Large ribosomal subunit protein uL24 n=2 Tax=Candidatus Magasanikiibacteriota TaxID=1752731 RepID=A0A1F6N9H6_9BACT|nr:MAG: 50S ribosomal protein L24 [Candidatus Magasanikbacteria bacterium RIFCSPHIGHO2_02_FULL_45_10]OGH80539.1 MAG: 50S ribosomal protein L24 [Candidatus Magasanikbacteria bacterium RIFCSPLOWO2_02_FULL_44_11]
MKIKVNDKVKILSGKDAGKEGKVIQVFPKEAKIVVEGVNIIKKHIKAKKSGEKGSRIELAGPIYIGKAMLIDPKSGKPTRVGYKLDGDKKRRVAKATGEFID